jgi:hypothetical protein
MTTLTAPTAVSEGLQLLVRILQTTTIPGPYSITYCVIADTDAEGIAAIDRIGCELERAGIDHHIRDTEYDREIVIPLAEDLDYRIFYVFSAAMAAAERRNSYRCNIA